jgi:hypothetical protein
MVRAQHPESAAKPCEIRPPEKTKVVAGDAVRIEPVSTRNSLLTGNFTGNFATTRPFLETAGRKRAQTQRVTCKFPTLKNREFWAANRELQSDISEFG